MDEPVPKGIQHPETPTKVVSLGIKQPTSDERMHQETALGITANLNKARHPAIVENVKVDHRFKYTPELKKLGAEPVGSDLSVDDAVRVITEELGDTTAAGRRTVTGEGKLPVSLMKHRLLRRFTKHKEEKAA